jgi:hypothetical protein
MAKNTKQSKQKKSVLNKLGGLSKRSKFIVVVLIFAVLGGGYLTYKSFAATAAVAPIQTLAEKMLFNGYSNGCTSNKVTDASKNNALVMNIYCPPNKAWDIYTSSGTMTVRWPRGTYKNCVMAKGVGKFSITQDGNSDNEGQGAKYYNINSPDYKEYCSNAVTIGSAGQVFSKNDSGRLTWSNNQDPNLLTISSMTKRWYAPGTAPAPSGK